MDIFNPDFRDFLVYLNQYHVEYILVGGYAVILRGYSRSTGDMDIWVNRTEENFIRIQKAIIDFGIPAEAIPKSNFFSDQYDVFSFGKPPYAIELMTKIKGLNSFEEAFDLATLEKVDAIEIRVIHLKHLIEAKKASGRYRDLNDIENLPKPASDETTE
jgi:hypothetical protein